MSDFNYTAPDPKIYLHTLRQYLETVGKTHIAELLINSSCEISPSTSYSGNRWNAYATTIFFRVPISNIGRFTEEDKSLLKEAADAVLPKDVGFDITEIQISPLLEAPPKEDDLISNSATLVTAGSFEHDGLRFRSKTEIKIYDTLKKRNVLFFSNATAVLGSKNVKREPDFLVCQTGKWGILEVMGDRYHTGATAMRDHDRARLFKDYSLYCIEFYDATKCYADPDGVIDDFLKRLSKF